jgi:hypothetical protein
MCRRSPQFLRRVGKSSSWHRLKRFCSPKSVERFFSLLSQLHGSHVVAQASSSPSSRAGTGLPPRIVEDLRLARTRMESGCHSLCDIAADLRNIEIQLFPVLLGVSEGEVHAMMELLSKAMNGSLERRDIDLSPLKPVLVDCTIPRLCTNSTSDRRALVLWDRPDQ